MSTPRAFKHVLTGLLLGSFGCGQDSLSGVPQPPAQQEAVCPAETAVDTTLDAGLETTYTFRDAVPGASGNGEFFVSGPEGEQVSGTVPTQATSGAYEVTVPLFCGAQEVRLSWTVNDCPHARVYHVTTNSCRPAEIRATLNWDADGRDWELHLIRPGGRINDPLTDCTWNTCVNTTPDWGVVGDDADDPHKDIDDLDGYGPENIFLSNPGPGTYYVLVEHWNDGGDPSADGEVQLNVGGQLTVVPIENLRPHFVRYVATIDWPSGVVTPLVQVMDCSANWSSGCLHAIP